jgi:hypothetical protein
MALVTGSATSSGNTLARMLSTGQGAHLRRWCGKQRVVFPLVSTKTGQLLSIESVRRMSKILGHNDDSVDQPLMWIWVLPIQARVSTLSKPVIRLSSAPMATVRSTRGCR